MPKISIIVPIYNVEQYLRKCIYSLINQTYKNLEIILINDGSSDNSGLICDEYAKKDDRIKVIHKENEGVSVARNIGLDIATGEYIFFIDSDDYLNTNAILILFDNLKKYDADISMCEYIRVYDYNYKEKTIKEDIKIYKNIEALEKLYNDTFTFHENYGLFISPGSKLYKKKLFENIRYPIGKFYEDGATIYKVLYNAKKIVHTNLILYYYYQRQGSTSRKKIDKTRLDRLDAFRSQIEFYKENKLYNLYYSAFNTYLNMIIEYYYLFREEIDGENISTKMKVLFNKEFQKAKKEFDFPKKRLNELKEFKYPNYYSIKKRLKKEGVIKFFLQYIEKFFKKR